MASVCRAWKEKLIIQEFEEAPKEPKKMPIILSKEMILPNQDDYWLDGGQRIL